MVATSCHTHLHSVAASPSVERLALAAYMKPAVLLEMELDMPRLPTVPLVKELIIRQIRSRRRT